MKDFFGKTFEALQQVVYPGRRGSGIFLTSATVLEVGAGYITVSPLASASAHGPREAGTKPVRIVNTGLVVIVK